MFKTKYVIGLLLLVILSALPGCEDDDLQPPASVDTDLTHIPYGPEAYSLMMPFGFPRMEHPVDNPQTVDGVQLGRKLFFDPILSLDSTIACASCHKPELSFTDGLATSLGVDGKTGSRSSMSLLNVAFHGIAGLFWDGRSKTLEEQALEPIVNPLEMANTWKEVETRLARHPMYQDGFRRAFGISKASEITRDLTVKAIAQFERILISSGNSDYDRFNQNLFALDDEAQNGFELFFDDILPNSECGHCHNAILFTTNEFKNNGLDAVNSVDDYTDYGLADATGLRTDQGKFKIPTLRNVLFTAPYMHDGRFETIEEVLDHYNSGGHHVGNLDEDNVDLLLMPLGLSERNKEQLIAFIGSLSDIEFLNNPDFQSPFE